MKRKLFFLLLLSLVSSSALFSEAQAREQAHPAKERRALCYFLDLVRTTDDLKLFYEGAKDYLSRLEKADSSAECYMKKEAFQMIVDLRKTYFAEALLGKSQEQSRKALIADRVGDKQNPGLLPDGAIGHKEKSSDTAIQR